MNDFFVARKRSRNASAKGRTEPSDFFRNLELDFVEHVAFFQAFMREPASVGAVSPSSRALARSMIEGFSLAEADTVVELGAGTGSFTGLIRDRISRDTTFVTVELDPTYASLLQKRFPGLIVHQKCAQHLPDILARHRKQSADYIVSGLPWASLPLGTQDRIIDVVQRCLPPHGVFTTFAYVHARWLPKARRFRQCLEARFDRVETSRVVWNNLPPAVVYRCSQRRLAPSAVQAVSAVKQQSKAY